ncbi:MAG: ankyrin repeat domain-containing protein [Parachlamydiaceae bacterium]|nr:MAG: ankyrin repeat domain-containing protein [Parachlamydiaceae bacterium]
MQKLILSSSTKKKHAITWSSKKHDIKLVEFLLNQGAPADFPDDSGQTPLMTAILEQHWESVELLIPKTNHSLHKALTLISFYGNSKIEDLQSRKTFCIMHQNEGIVKLLKLV